MSGHLVLVRHGQTAYNQLGKLQGHLDTPLDEVGQRQVATLAAHLATLDLPVPTVHTSDLRRAVQTATPIAQRLGCSLIPTPALREIQLGEWQDQRLSDLQRLYPAEFARYLSGDPHHRPPAGETPHEVGQRLLAYVRAHWPQPQQTVIIVTHGLALTAALCRLLERDYQSTWQTRTLEHGNTQYSHLWTGEVGQIRRAALVQRP